MIKSIEGKIAENQDIEKSKSCKPESGKREKAEQSDLEISQSAHGLTRDSIDFRDLYEEYRESQVVLLPVEPYLIHVYWDVTSNDVDKAKQWLGDDYGKSQAILRFYDVTDIIFDGTNARGSFDVDIDLQSKNWYVDLWSADKSYFVDLGFKTGDGFFLPVTRSSVAKTPCARPAPEADEHYMFVTEDAEEGLSKIKVPEEFFPQSIQAQYEKKVDFDLTEMSEKAFTLGISS